MNINWVESDQSVLYKGGCPLVRTMVTRTLARRKETGFIVSRVVVVMRQVVFLSSSTQSVLVQQPLHQSEWCGLCTNQSAAASNLQFSSAAPGSSLVLLALTHWAGILRYRRLQTLHQHRSAGLVLAGRHPLLQEAIWPCMEVVCLGSPRRLVTCLSRVLPPCTFPVEAIYYSSQLPDPSRQLPYKEYENGAICTTFILDPKVRPSVVLSALFLTSK